MKTGRYFLAALLCCSSCFTWAQRPKYALNPWQICISYAPEISYRTLRGKEQPVGNPNLSNSLRRKNEVAQFGMTGGLHVCYEFSSGLSAETGFEYAHRGFNAPKSDYKDMYHLQNPNVYLTYSRDFYSLAIPLRVNYTNGGEKWRFLASAAVSFTLVNKVQQTGILTRADGTTEEADGGYFHVQPENIKRNAYAAIGCGADYTISERFHVRLEGMFRHGFTNVFRRYYGLGYLWNAGVEAGVYYRL